MHAAYLLTQRATLTPNRTAVVDLQTGQSLTYAHINERANRAANFLTQELGIQKGDRVSILAYNHLAFIDLLYGAAKIGAIFAPLNWRLTAAELVYIVNDCQPRALICGPEFTGVLEEMMPHLQVEHYLSIEGAQLADGLIQLEPYEAALDRAAVHEAAFPDLTADDPLCLLYTSGTTGRPKGAVLPHRQVLWNCINTTISWGLTQDDITPVLTPMFHAGGLFAFLAPILYVGGRIVLARSFDPAQSLQVIQDEKCTVILGVPTMFQMWMDAPGFQKADFSHVRFFISGGAPCPIPLIETWQKTKGVVFRQGYGLTEAGTNCFSMTDEESVRKAGSVGKPIYHSWMRLVDQNSQEVAPGETGELLIAGPHVCLGYWNRPEATAEALQVHFDFPWPWLHTGDMARQDAEGYYFIAGRFKDMIISGGENVYAAEVEAVFREHPSIADAALIGAPDEKWGEVGIMAVVLKPGHTVSAGELLVFCRQRLARYKVPKQVVFKPQLPYSPYGKVMKAELKKDLLGQAS
jgi:fatty-acyl-CoA synthase